MILYVGDFFTLSLTNFAPIYQITNYNPWPESEALMSTGCTAKALFSPLTSFASYLAQTNWEGRTNWRQLGFEPVTF